MTWLTVRCLSWPGEQRWRRIQTHSNRSGGIETCASCVPGGLRVELKLLMPPSWRQDCNIQVSKVVAVASSPSTGTIPTPPPQMAPCSASFLYCPCSKWSVSLCLHCTDQ
ncbi:hypothetical protein O3P69_002589 [Scylla paramamosain]|uniref:Uncharacterized protein n=1 Tax=Scylla paramamosain TaxID=85552 RepID=A0AAW0ULB3_SCYPA